MAERRKETKTNESPVGLFAPKISRNVGYTNFFTTDECERIAQKDILREIIGEPFAPLDDAHIRVIDIQRSVARAPRLDRLILQIVAELKEKVSDLEKQLGEITEIIQETSKIYNATIYELGNSHYQLTIPIQIVIEENQDETVARIPELNLYASADTDSEAINDLKCEVINLYEDLISSDIILGPLPKSWLETLKKLIVKRNG